MADNERSGEDSEAEGDDEGAGESSEVFRRPHRNADESADQGPNETPQPQRAIGRDGDSGSLVDGFLDLFRLDGSQEGRDGGGAEEDDFGEAFGEKGLG